MNPCLQTCQGYTGRTSCGRLVCVLIMFHPPPHHSFEPLLPSLAQVIFGDLNSGTQTSCSWFARSGTNLTYDLELKSFACPTTLLSSRAITVADYWQAFNASFSETQSPTPSVTPSQTPTPSWSPRPSPVEHCFDHVLNFDETDIDCGGPCAPCVPGRICRYDIDCDSSLSNVTGTTLTNRDVLVVCNANNSRCVDLRASTEAYNPSLSVNFPRFTQISVMVFGFSSFFIVPSVIVSVQSNLTAALALLNVPLASANQVIFLEVRLKRHMSPPFMRSLFITSTLVPCVQAVGNSSQASNTPSTNLTIWLLLPLLDPTSVAGQINLNQTAITDAILLGLSASQAVGTTAGFSTLLGQGTAVSFTSAASATNILPPIPRTGPALDTPKGKAISLPLSMEAIIAIAAGGGALLIIAIILVSWLCLRRGSGKCCGSTAFSTCCGAWPMSSSSGKYTVAEDWVKSPVAGILPVTAQDASVN